MTAVVLAHTDPPHVRRLTAALGDRPVVLHCDAKTDDDSFNAMIGPRVIPAPRVRTELASWSLVQAELGALRLALTETDATHIAVLSGADYPLMPVGTIEAHLIDGESLLWNVPLPHDKWNTRLHRDGGRWRIRYRFWCRDDNVISVAGVPLRSPFPRRVPQDVQLRAGTQWKIYARRHAEALLRCVEERPDLVDFWRSTLVPDETFTPSVLASEELVGADTVPPRRSHPWFMVWPSGHHPRWLGPDNFDAALTASRRPDPKLFARKFSSQTGRALLDRIDAELLS